MLFRFSWLAPSTALLLACASSSVPPQTVDEQATSEHRQHSGVAVSSEIGGLDEAEVNTTFESSLSGLERCLRQGASRVEFLSGSVAFFLKIGTAGRLEAAYLEKSSLGNRATEKCMLEVMSSRNWPKPVGGEHGLARKSFDFDPPNDVREPADYDRGHLDQGIEKISAKLAACKSARGTYEATLYVATDGSVLSAGVTPPSEEGERSVDCLVSALEQAAFPSPGSWPAKITFSL